MNAQLTSAERADREEFVVEGCYLMRNRDIAERVEQEHAAEFAARQAEVDAAIASAEP